MARKVGWRVRNAEVKVSKALSFFFFLRGYFSEPPPEGGLDLATSRHIFFDKLPFTKVVRSFFYHDYKPLGRKPGVILS